MIPAGFIVLYAVLWFGIVLGSLALWIKRRRRRRVFPFKDGVRFLRHPGETLRNKVASLEETVFHAGILGYLLPPLAALGVVVYAPWLSRRLGERIGVAWVFGTAAAVLLVGISIVVIFVVRKWSELTDHYLGYCGERYVAEHLRPLERKGWVVFHDVPASRGDAKFNLDHVAIGPGGVVVIETKAPRKYVKASGHEISFDGKLLTWPNGGRNRNAVDEALANADWLREFFHENLGQDVKVLPILTFPTWCVWECKPPRDDVRVISPKYLLRAIASRGRNVLTQQQINLYGRQVARICRNVAL